MSSALYERIKSNKFTSNGEYKNLKYGICEMQGWRNEMEDSNCVFKSQSDQDEWSFYAVFDGHGGSFSSKMSSEYLWGQIYQEMLENSSRNRNDSKNSFRLNSLSPEEIINSVKNGFYTFDRKLLERVKSLNYEDKSGTTVIAALITINYIYLINCGDSRGILVRDNQIEINTFDHKPTQLKERQRIQNAGGLVALNRVNGGLATSRGLGDFDYKNIPNLDQNKQFVTCEPDVYVSKRSLNDRYLVLACDGIWDVLDNESVKNLIDQKLQTTNINNENFVELLSEDLVLKSFEKGSKDNMSAVIIYFSQKMNKTTTTNNNKIDESLQHSARGIRKESSLNSRSDLSQSSNNIKKISSAVFGKK
ncbi:unnamed protein product [Brachionus calyciflorus]|uniref:protein-serine/threonine phosphatase n=1 Tax=Brachionus calyciflorus TaxID=104777 RepID=A0A813M906_9BILA|nr:unnamed protein product [Brachionus calyciflorus]